MKDDFQLGTSNLGGFELLLERADSAALALTSKKIVRSSDPKVASWSEIQVTFYGKTLGVILLSVERI